MILNSTSDIIRLRLGQAVTTNQLSWVTGYNDHTATTFTPADEDGLSNGITNATIVSSPAASTQRQVTTINVFNRDTVQQTVTIEKFDGSNARVLCNCSLAVNDTLYWSRESGWTVLKGTSTQVSYILREYIANSTWNRPGGIKAAILVAVGAGGGGGSGRRGAAGTDRFGGGGGGGGALVRRLVMGSSLPATLAITTGTAGTGGAAQTVDTNNGNPGTNGGDTSIGSLVVAKGGSAGSGGTTATGSPGSGGLPSACTPSFGPYSLNGGSGSTGATTGISSAGAGFDSSQNTPGAPGGAGGRGINSANTSGTGTLTVGGIYSSGVVIGSTTTVGANGTNDLAGLLQLNSLISGLYGVGSAGNGGAVAGAGGNGGRCAGGGGGGGSLNGTNSGKGGDGGGGLAQILEIY